MKTKLTHITEIKIKTLFGEESRFVWKLNSYVNILAGDNGSGKSTIINLIFNILRDDYYFLEICRKKHICDISIIFNDSSIILIKKSENSDDFYITVNGKHVTVGDGELKIPIKLDIVNTFDQPLLPLEHLQKRNAGETYLDFLIEKLETKYLNYQVDIGKRALDALSNNIKIQEIGSKKELFFDIINHLFSYTSTKKKYIDRHANGFSFNIMTPDFQPKHVISPYQLSSGEKHLLIILATVLVQDNQHAILLIDNPEISLHCDWQKELIDNIRKLNDNVQIIITTHSPSIIMHGWFGEGIIHQMD